MLKSAFMSLLVVYFSLQIICLPLYVRRTKVKVNVIGCCEPEESIL